MKTTAVLGMLALVPSALGLGTCHAGQRYCGSWLIDKDGYSVADLQKAVHGPNVKPYPPPHDNWRDSLFLCNRRNEIEFMEYCWQGCHESGGDGENDVCNIGF
ncbi:hypothetical protein ATEIFO6365_0001110100 [Aspergillus terreus]|uniref:Uncharacterized protein n=1 Tax=Aspergillus terreus TaxID=33178 RepID=A0A5M3YRX0_ASPTE|nr:hypothetical protein ATETN484_0001102200 [Aspergillus terreus]GFF12877.1 hypothetical protein ATEIFO6365_0001110100 [Aspergillus terreus]